MFIFLTDFFLYLLLYLWILQPFFEVHGPGIKDTKNYTSVNNMYQEEMVNAKNSGYSEDFLKGIDLHPAFMSLDITDFFANNKYIFIYVLTLFPNIPFECLIRPKNEWTLFLLFLYFIFSMAKLFPLFEISHITLLCLRSQKVSM